MRRADLLPLALLAGLVIIVGGIFIRQPKAPLSPAIDPPAPAEAETLVASIAAVRHPPSMSGGRSDGHVASETRRSALKAPEFNAEEIRRRLGYGAAGTYIFPMLAEDSGLARWPDRGLDPVRVWVEPTSSVADWRADYAIVARQAFDYWVAAGIPVRLSFPVDSAGAEVIVLWTDRFTDSRIGTTRRFRDQHWWIVAGEIALAVHHTSGALLDPEVVRAAAIHEAGHVLGLNHSPDTLDIMASRHHSTTVPSPADLATMRLLYSVPPGRLR
jgi:hypothetical protein